MPSRTMELCRNQQDPKVMLSCVYDRIVTAERTFPIPDDLKNYFNRTISGQIGREWGCDRMEFTDFDAYEGYFILRFEYEDYCRGCHMGTEHFQFKLPDDLVEAYEKWDELDDGAGANFDALLTAFMESRIVKLRSLVDAQKQKEEAEAEAARIRAEEHERAQFERLKAKFEHDGS